MTITKDDLYFYNKGKLYDAYRIFGAHLRKDAVGKILGTEFTVWAPHAKEVSVLGEFNGFQAWVHNLSKVDDTGIWNLPVVDQNNLFIGFISKSSILMSYRQVLKGYSE